MTETLCKLFFGKCCFEKKENRTKIGSFATIVGIIFNLILFGIKLFAGIVFVSSAILSDAFNNLSDAGSSIISLISFLISGKPPDRDHPFGHARIEYIASLIVSFLIFLVSFELIKDGIDGIINPIESTFDWLTVVLLIVAILIKVWLGIFYRKIGTKIDSAVLMASSTDAFNDVLSTGGVLLSCVIVYFTGFVYLDSIVGILVALLIFKSGMDIFKDTLNALLGEGPTEKLMNDVKSVVAEYPGALGIHDLFVHNYGPNHTIVSLHVEVDGNVDIFQSHDMIDNIEREIKERLNIICTIHLDPIVTDNEEINRYRELILTVIHGIEPTILMHDFRFVNGETHQNFLFDIEVPFEIKKNLDEITEEIKQKVREQVPNSFCIITVDRV